ncbi:MAG TPA: ABC transporter substrate-binding protein [Solirubrobacteraceae bacterium]|jgi:taurine transport system substrate-binding protein
MSTSRRPRRWTLPLAALAVLALLLAGCGGDDEGSGGGKASGGAPKTIRIAYQAIPNGDLVVKHEKYLEKAFPDSKIEWKLFDSGGTVNEAVAARAVDFGLAGSSPVSRGLSTPLPYKVPWIHDVIGKAEALVVKPEITSFADLKGKKIATPLASTSHLALLAALDKEGIDQKDVDIIDAEPDDIYAAWTRGDIDGAYVWNPNLAKLKSEGGKFLVDSEQLANEGVIKTYDLAVVSNDFADKYPDAVATWAKQQDKAVKLIKSDEQKAAADIAAELSIKPEEAAAQMKDLIYLDAGEQASAENLGGDLAKNLFESAKINQKLGQIPEVPSEDTFTKGVDASFAQKASGGS